VTVDPNVTTVAINAASWKKHHSSVTLSGWFPWWPNPGPKAFGPGLFCWTISGSRTGVSHKSFALEHDSLVNPKQNTERTIKKNAQMAYTEGTSKAVT
jgi:hypothetical protein